MPAAVSRPTKTAVPGPSRNLRNLIIIGPFVVLDDDLEEFAFEAGMKA